MQEEDEAGSLGRARSQRRRGRLLRWMSAPRSWSRRPGCWRCYGRRSAGPWGRAIAGAPGEGDEGDEGDGGRDVVGRAIWRLRQHCGERDETSRWTCLGGRD